LGAIAISVIWMVEEALRSLCSTSKSFVGALSMIFLIIGVMLHIANYFINSGKPKTSRPPLLWLAGTLFLALAVLGIIVYVVFPPIMAVLIGPNVTQNPCYPDSSPEPDLPPYCGGYCTNKSIPKPNESCTCLMY
jgi:hypothetical protein